ncbi:MAG: hypothetical protein ACK4IS_13565 [Erythrobacter sp.]
MTAPLEHEGSTTRRLDRVESDVSALATAVSDLRGDVRGFGQVLVRIENSITNNEGRMERERLAKQPNALAFASAMFTVLVTLIGGAWVISGQLSRLDERDIQRDKQVERIEELLDRKAEK